MLEIWEREGIGNSRFVFTWCF